MGDEPGRAAANNNLGSCYQLMGSLDAARRHYAIALEADERVGDHVDMAIIHNNIGEILLIQGKLDDAEASLQQVLTAHRKDEELSAVAGLAYVNLCRCSMARGDLDQAYRSARFGMRLLRSVGAQGLLTEARLQLAELLIARGDLAAAQRESQRALKDAMASGDRLLEARGERIVGIVRSHSGGIDAAAIRIATSAGLARNIGAAHEEARSLVALARLRIDAAGRPRSAGLRRAVAIFARMGAAPELRDAEALLARLEGLAPGPA
jgi:Tfp pilus assembly protein PilF